MEAIRKREFSILSAHCTEECYPGYPQKITVSLQPFWESFPFLLMRKQRLLFLYSLYSFFLSISLILSLYSFQWCSDIARVLFSNQSPRYSACYMNYYAVLSFISLISINRDIPSVMYIITDIVYIITDIILTKSPGTAEDTWHTRA